MLYSPRCVSSLLPTILSPVWWVFEDLGKHRPSLVQESKRAETQAPAIRWVRFCWIRPGIPRGPLPLVPTHRSFQRKLKRSNALTRCAPLAHFREAITRRTAPRQAISSHQQPKRIPQAAHLDGSPSLFFDAPCSAPLASPPLSFAAFPLSRPRPARRASAASARCPQAEAPPRPASRAPPSQRTPPPGTPARTGS